MNKNPLLSTLAGVFFGTILMAGNSEQFKVDDQKLNSDFNKINQVESYVIENNATFADVEINNPALLTDMNLDQNTGNTVLGPELGMGDGPLGLPSFLWGCVLSWVGILIVYFITEDSDETKKALWGALVGIGAYIIFYVVFIVLIF